MDIRRELQQNKFQLDKPFEHLFTKWQRNMFRLNKSLIWIATVIEIIIAIGGISERVYSFGVLGYFLRCVFVPFLINVGVYCLGIWMYQHPTISDEHKVAVPILTMIIMFTSLVTIHYVFPMLLGVFIIPVFISTIYANRNVVLRTFGFSCMGIIFSLLMTFINHRETVQRDYLANIFIVIAMMIFVLVVAMGTVENERAKVDVIKRSMRSTARLKEEASHDGLTGLYNRKTIMDILKEYMQRAKRGKSLHIAVIDIDHFKMINDTYGHSNGDVVLRALAGMFRSLQNRNIIAGRYGGEEFVILFYGVPFKYVYEQMNELREQFAICAFPELDNNQVTISAGIATYQNDMDLVEFFDEADRAMYKAKQLGRNRVETAS